MHALWIVRCLDVVLLPVRAREDAALLGAKFAADLGPALARQDAWVVGSGLGVLGIVLRDLGLHLGQVFLGLQDALLVGVEGFGLGGRLIARRRDRVPIALLGQFLEQRDLLLAPLGG